jgi:hypothetical protein
MKKIDKNAMAQGYVEMAKVNLMITQEDFHLESEGASLGYEMDITQAQGKAQ